MCSSVRFVPVLLVLVLMSSAEAQGVGSSPSIQGSVHQAWTLDVVVMAALAQHPLVEAAQARVEAARAERSSAGALLNPTGTFWLENAAYPGQHLPASVARETSLYVSFPLDPLFQRGARSRRADEDVRAAHASLTLARRAVAAETVQSFFAVVLAQALQDEAEENCARFEQLVAYNRARVEAGVTAEGELMRLEVELDRARNDVVFTGVELTRQRAKLAPYMAAHSVETDLGLISMAVPSSDIFLIDLLPTLDAAQAMGRARRPEIVMGRARAAAAEASIAYERSLAVRQTGATFGNKRSDGVNSMVAGLSLTLPLFNTNGSGVARATHERLAAGHELVWAERLVAADLQSAHASAIRLTQQLNELRQTFLARATEVHRLTLGAYQEGGATLLQVLDATRMFADARLTYARTLFAQRESVFRLALATGSDPLDALDVLRTWSAAPARAARAGEQP